MNKFRKIKIAGIPSPHIKYLYFYEQEIALVIEVSSEMRLSFAIIQKRKAYYSS